MVVRQVLGIVKRYFYVKPLIWLCRLIPYEPIRVTSNKWETAYAGGVWDWIGKVDQLSRYSIITGYCHFYKPSASILDLGCGEGWQAERMDKLKYHDYLGIDISSEAINRARKFEDEKTEFRSMNVEDVSLDKEYDIIIFNEILYYLDDPVAMMDRLIEGLTEDGIMIVSMYNSEMTKKLWRAIESKYTVLDEVGLKNRKGVVWYVKVLTPERAA